jgi:CRISPR-associated protein (TIGR03986 family)
MPGKTDKKHRIRVRTLDGKPRDYASINKLKSNQLGMPHLDIVGTSIAHELIICASKDTHIERVRTILGSAGLEEVADGDTAIAARATPKPTQQPRQGRGGQQQRHGEAQRGGGQRRLQHGGHPADATTNSQPLRGKPYGFVALPKDLTTSAPIWHDGTSSAGRHSGEIRFELETLTPLLVGWERGQVGDDNTDWPVAANLADAGQLPNGKSVLCPLRAPWGKRPVVVPGDSLKGLLRHELGALLGAPMERVAERSYSYRPNLKFPYDQRDQRYRLGTASLEPRLVRVRTSATIQVVGKPWRVPEEVDVLSMATRDQQVYFPRRDRESPDIVHPTREAEPYRGGLAGGKPLPDAVLSEDARRKLIHTHIDVRQLRVEHRAVRTSSDVMKQYEATQTHLLDTENGHFSARHPSIGTDQHKQRLGREAVEKGAERAFQPGDLVWVEWNTERRCIVSFGWHYYYRWAYTDSVCIDADAPRLERHGLFPLDGERETDGYGAPNELSPVRRLFGYVRDTENGGASGIGKGDHEQLMGRVFVNAGLEVVGENDRDEDRFLKSTFLKELGMPKPSAVEHYLKQPHHPRSRPSDNATLVTYGDAAGYDTPGELAGRKFYLDRKDAYTGAPWEDASDTNKQNDRSTLALEASKPRRKFRFTIRFRDLDAAELAAILVALCPDQFKGVLGGTLGDGYCSKLGYARPLGWGSVHIDAKALLLLDDVDSTPTLKQESDLDGWVRKSYQKTATQDEWLATHRRNHPEAADYPSQDGQIYTFHTSLRAQHSRNRRYRNGGAR